VRLRTRGIRGNLLRRHPVWSFVIERVGLGLITLLAVSIVVFAATDLLPGSAATVLAGAKATPAEVHTISVELGLTKPAWERYGDWLGGILRGDLGTSLVSQGSGTAGVGGGPVAHSRGEPVADVIAEPIENTAILAGITILLLIPLSLFFGLIGGLRAGKPIAEVASGATIAGLSVPDFIVGTVLILIFALRLGWLPPISLVRPGTSPLAHPEILVLPVATLLIVTLGFPTRQVRAGVIRVSASEYVELARLSGMTRQRILTHYILRNALAPSLQSVTQTIQYLLGGVVLTEFVFGYPGIGAGFVQYVEARDLPTVAAVGLLIAAMYVALNIAADILVVLAVPRLRTGQWR
jgi:peptide/nickel transport system permease protein